MGLVRPRWPPNTYRQNCWSARQNPGNSRNRASAWKKAFHFHRLIDRPAGQRVRLRLVPPPRLLPAEKPLVRMPVAMELSLLLRAPTSHLKLPNPILLRVYENESSLVQNSGTNTAGGPGD
jgi:hypothetical protein